MKFSELPQLTRTSSNIIDCELDLFVQRITEEIEEGLVLNPDFQRGHIWTEEQQVAFIEYFLMGGDIGIIWFNAPDWPSVYHDGNYVCVDGLQRITAFQKFYNNEIRAFGYYYKDFEEKRPRHWIKYSVNNLKTRQEVLQWYLEINSGGTPHSKEEIDRVKELLRKEKEKHTEQ
ncbi:MAG: DUF262 domain-containing protein [Lachnospiraceae bacterium]|nr:DUF262 domain-containing protein [Lachnospiraceae bacterium]